VIFPTPLEKEATYETQISEGLWQTS